MAMRHVFFSQLYESDHVVKIMCWSNLPLYIALGIWRSDPLLQTLRGPADPLRDPHPWHLCNVTSWRLDLEPWDLALGAWTLGTGLGAFGFGWGLGSGFGYVDLASCGSWSLGLEAWGLDWGSDLGFGLGLALVDVFHGTFGFGH